MQAIEAQMDENKLFLKTGFAISDLSKDTQIPVYQISRSLNTFKGISFVDFVNQVRIKYCVEQFNKGEWLNYTLEAVAKECGFSNRNSFTKAFIKFKGESPSQHRSKAKQLPH